MNEFVALLGIQSWKPFLTLLALPPIPFLVLVLVGARLVLPRRGLGWTLIVVSVAGIWITSCNGFAILVNDLIIRPPAPLSESRIGELQAEVKTKSPVAIVILGGGRDLLAPEYGISNLVSVSLERLRYGIWLSRRTNAPIGFAGGVGWSQPDDISESEVAGRIAAQEFGRPIRWLDTKSRDTRENAAYMMSQLRPAGITKVLLVTNGWHMPRAVRNFEQAVQQTGGGIEIIPAPMGLSKRSDGPAFDWFPTADGFTRTRNLLKEVLAKILGV